MYPTTVQWDNRDLARKIVAFLAARRLLDEVAIHVKADRGAIAIRGQVRSERERSICIECCRHVAGVVRVEDQLQVANEQAPDTSCHASHHSWTSETAPGASTSSVTTAHRPMTQDQDASPATEWYGEYALSVPDGQFLCDLTAAMELAGYANGDILGVRLALEEAVINAHTLGNRRDTTKRIRISCRVTSQCVRADVEDEGRGYKATQAPDTRSTTTLNQNRRHGVSLMQTLMTLVRFNRRGNRVTLFKRRSQECGTRIQEDTIYSFN